MRFFKYEHLPANLQARSAPFSAAAHLVLNQCEEAMLDRLEQLRFIKANELVQQPNTDEPDWAEVMVGLRNLLIAKDNIVRAFLPR